MLGCFLYNPRMDAAKTYHDLLWQDPDRMSGAICFFGTRIPVSFLFDYLESGRSIEEFSTDYEIDADTARQVVHLATVGFSALLESAA